MQVFLRNDHVIMHVPLNGQVFQMKVVIFRENAVVKGLIKLSEGNFVEIREALQQDLCFPSNKEFQAVSRYAFSDLFLC